MLIYLIGLPGVGKSYTGNLLSQKINYSFLDLDQEIEKSIGLTVSEIFEYRGENYFREIEREELLKTTKLNRTVIACGGGTPCFFDNMEVIKSAGHSVYLQNSISKILENILNDKERPLLTDNVENNLNTLLEERERHYKEAEVEVQVNENVIDSIISALNLQKG